MAESNIDCYLHGRFVYVVFHRTVNAIWCGIYVIAARYFAGYDDRKNPPKAFIWYCNSDQWNVSYLERDSQCTNLF